MDKLTTKQIQAFKFLYAFWQEAKGGEVRIIHHDNEPQNIIILDGKTEFDGKDKKLDEMKLLLSSVFKT